MRSVSPIFSAILLFLIALSVATLVVLFVWRSFSGAQSLVSMEALRAGISIRSRLSVVYTAYGDWLGFVALYNPSNLPVKILAVYVNGAPARWVEVLCGSSYQSMPLPVEIKPRDVCVVTVLLGPPALYRVTIATSFGNLELSIAG